MQKSTISKFLSSESVGTDLLNEYCVLAENLLYADENDVIRVIEKIKQNIVDYAIKNSLIYKDFNSSRVYTKQDLCDTQKWYSKDLLPEIEQFRTSGSTTGDPFYYGVWRKYISLIEDKYQYGMILDEFGIEKKHINIVVLSQLPYSPAIEGDLFFIQEIGPTSFAMHGHKSVQSTRSFVNFEKYTVDPDGWHEKFFQMIDALSEIDVILCSASKMRLICKYIKKFNYKNKLCKLLSHTGELPSYDDFYFLKNNGYIDSFCDSMRCWDGGATFFSCKFETRHLMDNISWTYEADGGKLVSTDYFSMAAPFVNYWNGDLCEISREYQRCKCGRLYRPFKMLESRPFEVKGPKKLNEIKKLISELDFAQIITHVQFNGLSVNITVSEAISKEQEEILQEILIGYKLYFLIL